MGIQALIGETDCTRSIDAAITGHCAPRHLNISGQTKEGQQLSRKAGRYAHARQFKRMRRAIKRQRTIVARLQREIERKASAIGAAVRQALGQTLSKALRIVAQSGQRKTADGNPKLYAWHATEVDCISKGKAKQPYEFGVKVGIASTLNGNLIVGARAFHGNPYDGHTLNEQLEQATILMQDSRVRPSTAFVDLGYRGVDAQNPDVHIVHRGKSKRISEQDRKHLKRRQAIEPIIGHLKADHRMDRCHLKGETGDRLHAVLCAAGYNIQWLLRMIVRKGVAFLGRLFLRLFGHAHAQRLRGVQGGMWEFKRWLAKLAVPGASAPQSLHVASAAF